MPEEKKYPGPEGFWRQSPELIGLQDDLKQLWLGLEASPPFPEGDITSKKPGDLIAIRSRNPQYESYKIFELGSIPRTERYPRELYHIMPRVSKEEGDPQIMIYLEKWPSGYRINGEPVREGFDWGMFVHKGEAEFKDTPEQLRNEGIRLVALKLMRKSERMTDAEKQEGERILNIVKTAAEKTE